jgi:biotin carboxyl carrier protein
MPEGWCSSWSRWASACRTGDGLVILEAMKMENEFTRLGEGTVKEIRVQAGQAVNPGDVLLVIE